jgi:general secretion pathway protein L
MATITVLAPSARRFLQWWLQELAAMAPARLRAAARGRRQVLRLPGSVALMRTLALPAAAEATLRQAVELELERLTPFRAADLAFACRVAAWSGERLEVRLVVAPRRMVEDALVEAVARGLAPDAVEADLPGAEGLDLMPARPGRRLAPVLLAVAAALFAASVLIALERRQQAVDALGARIAQARVRAEAAAALRDRLERLDEGARALAAAKAARPAMVVVLDRLTRALPDEVWLTQLEVAEGEVRLWGAAPSASMVVRALEQAPGLSQAEFRSPVTQEPGLERFHIAARLGAGGDLP